jgi:hypothetical protein
MTNQQVRPLWNVYVVRGMALVPNVARTEAGYFLDVEPVRVAKVDDLQSLASAIEQAMAAGNPRVATPTRAAFPKPVVLEPAGMKTWKALERTGAAFTIFRGEDELEIAETGRNEDGEWVEASSNQKLTASSSAFEMAKRIAERVSQRADLQPGPEGRKTRGG